MAEEAGTSNLPPRFFSTLQSYKVPIILGSVSILLLVLSIVLLFKSYQTDEPIQFSGGQRLVSSSSARIESLITVDIEGAVIQPGLYRLPSGSRVEDAVSKAGGLSQDADIAWINQHANRAAKLVDGGKLYFPKTGEGQAVEGSMTSHIIDSTLVNVNLARQSELESLPGIGPITAGKIISNRPYQTIMELVTKKAMSQSLLDKLKDRLSL